jgi:hypothetical protein
MSSSRATSCHTRRSMRSLSTRSPSMSQTTAAGRGIEVVRAVMPSGEGSEWVHDGTGNINPPLAHSPLAALSFHAEAQRTSGSAENGLGMLVAQRGFTRRPRSAAAEYGSRRPDPRRARKPALRVEVFVSTHCASPPTIPKNCALWSRGEVAAPVLCASAGLCALCVKRIVRA